MLYSKKLILLFSIVFTTISITAQTLSKDVISSGGDYYQIILIQYLQQ